MSVAAALALALFFRLGGFATVSSRPALGWLLVRGIWRAVAAWSVGALMQAWVPLWQVLALSICLTLLVAASPLRFGRLPQLLADVILIGVMAALSVIPVAGTAVVLAAVGFGLSGMSLDWLVARLSRTDQQALLVLPVAALGIVGATISQIGDFGSRTLRRDPLYPLRLALAVRSPGMRFELRSGAAAWLSRTPRTEPKGTAVVLHGNHPLASRQPAAVALRGGLLRAGYDVLSVDHPAYGASARPDNDDLISWDPTTGPGEALRALRSSIGVRGPATIVAAHSMGVDVALKWLMEGAALQDAYLFGGSLDKPTAPEQIWVNAFYRDRGMQCCVPLQTLRRLRELYYSGADRFRVLPADHPVVHFIRFGIEYPDVARDRDALYTTIPPPKAACDLEGVTHYLNTLALPGLVLVDTLVVERTAEIFSGRACGTSLPE